MQLLSPNDIKTQKKDSAEETARRSQALAVEETRLAKAINTARQEAEEEISRIERDLLLCRTKTDKEKAELESQIASLNAERKELLKPIHEIREQAENTLREAEKFALSLQKERDALEEDRERNQEIAEANQDKINEINERERDLDKRGTLIEREELRLKVFAEQLSGEWLKLHKAIHQNNVKTKEILIREERVKIEHEANEVRQAEQDKRDQELDALRRELQSNYQALAKAREEILGRKG